MIVKANQDGNWGKDVNFVQDEEFEVTAEVGNQLIGLGIATPIQYDLPKKRDPKARFVAEKKIK